MLCHTVRKLVTRSSFAGLGSQAYRELSLCQNRAYRSPGTSFSLFSPIQDIVQSTIKQILRGTDAVCQIRRQLLERADVESVDAIASCFLRAAQVESVIDSFTNPATLRKSQKARRGDSSMTQSVRHAGSGNENCLMRTVSAGPPHPRLNVAGRSLRFLGFHLNCRCSCYPSSLPGRPNPWQLGR